MEIVSKTGVSFKQKSVGGFWGWTVTANNHVGLGQLYQVEYIETPYGRLVDVAVPIPADVVLAMGDSINQLQQQLVPLLTFVQPFNPNINVTIAEGDPMEEVAVIPIQNSGAFGSFLTAFATPDVPWLVVSPPSITGLGQNQQGKFTVTVNPATLLSSDSPYVGHINFQDSRNQVIILPVPIVICINVEPRPDIAVTPVSINFIFSISTMVDSGAQQILVSNDGPIGSLLNFSASKLLNNSPWLDVIFNGSAPLSPGESAPVTLSIFTPGVTLIVGTYNEIIRIYSSNADNSPIDVPVSLQVMY